jgi:hypothetical protein
LSRGVLYTLYEYDYLSYKNRYGRVLQCYTARRYVSVVIRMILQPLPGPSGPSGFFSALVTVNLLSHCAARSPRPPLAKHLADKMETDAAGFLLAEPTACDRADS